MIRRLFFATWCLTLACIASPIAQTAPRVTSPQQEFGHNFGDDYFLATYKQIQRL